MVKAIKGILYSHDQVRETKTYTIVNRNDQERLVLIEHPVRNDFNLTDDTDKPAETASDFYRFEVKVPAGKTATQTVTEERVIGEQIAADQQQRRPDPFLHQPDRRQPEGQGRPEAGAGAALGLEQDAARDRRAGAAAQGRSPTTRRGCGPT